MSQRTQRALRILSCSAAAALACSLAAAQDSAPPSIAEQLQAQYKLAKMTKNSNGNAVISEGTVLAIQKEGLTALPFASPLNPCASTYVEGRLKAAGFLCKAGREVGKNALGTILGNFGSAGSVGTDAVNVNTTTVNLAVGQRAYPATITVDTKRDIVKFSVVACDPCNATDPPTYYKAEVDFRLPKGLLATGDASQVEDTIGQVFSIDSGGDAAPAQDAPAGPARAASPAPAPAEPVSIQQGQTIAEVEQALGKPVKTLKVATKVIYIYSDLKITFRSGKVTDVQ